MLIIIYLQKYVFPVEKRDVNVTAFNIITRIDETETIVKHISCDCKGKFNATIYNSNKKWNNETCPCEFKNHRMCKKDYSWNPSTCTCGNTKHLKRIVDDSKLCMMKLCMLWILYQQICQQILKTKNSEILHTVLLLVILLFIIAIICYHCVKHKSKLKKMYCRTRNVFPN